MTFRTLTLGVPLLAIALIASLPPGAAELQAQSVTGVMPNWGDLEAWSRKANRDVDEGLGLQLSSSAGAMLVSFSARVPQGSTTSPKEVYIVAAPSLMSNPNVVRTPSLRFVADEGTKDQRSFDLTASLRVDDPSPGAVISSAGATMRIEDFVRLCQSLKLKGNVFGANVDVRADQIQALGRLAERLHVPVPKLVVVPTARP